MLSWTTEVFQRFFKSLYFRISLYKLYFLQGNFTTIIYISFKIIADFTWSDKFAIQKLNLIFFGVSKFLFGSFYQELLASVRNTKNKQF